MIGNSYDVFGGCYYCKECVSGFINFKLLNFEIIWLKLN